VIVPETSDAVLLGTAMTAAVAGGVHPDLPAAGRAMDGGGTERIANPERAKQYDRDYRRFLAMVRHRDELRSIG
jgi:ribulose kinase